MRFLCSLFLLIFISEFCIAQGIPSISNYTTEDYQSSPQNWVITQDTSGYLYFGNSSGLMWFDGRKWKAVHIRNNNIVSSLHTSSDGSILVGGLGEFGYIQPDSLSQISYYSLSAHLDSTLLDFSYVWDITEHKDKQYFRTQKRIFVVSGGEIHSLGSEYNIGNLEKVGDQLLVWLIGKGLHFIENQQFKFVEQSKNYSSDVLYAILPFGNDLLLCFREAGLVIFDGQSFDTFNTPASRYIKQFGIYKASIINDSQFALATLKGGIIIADLEGNINQVISEKEGLNTNIIYDLYLDREKNIWAATDNGLAKILINNPVTKIDERSDFSGIPTFIITVNSTTYFGSTSGLYYSSNSGNVQKVAGFEERVYGAAANGTTLLVSTANGIFSLQNKSAARISSSTYRIIKASATTDDVFYGMQGRTVFKILKRGNTLREEAIFTFGKPIQDLHVNDESLWIISGDEGLIRYSLSGEQQKRYTIDITEDLLYQKLGLLDDKLRLGTNTGLYFYSTELDSFVVDSAFDDPEIISSQVNGFKQCADDEIWFRNNRKIKRTIFSDGTWNVTQDPYRLIDEGESINTIECGEAGSMWFGGTAGIYQLSDPDWEYTHEFNTNITGLLVHNDSLIYGGYGEREEKLNLPYTENELRFTYAAASYIATEENMYRVRLKGYNDRWSNWTSETEKDYTFIAEGTYIFEVQGRNVYHKTGSIDTFTFTVLPPWYRTIWAYLLYLLIVGSIIYCVYRFRINNILREQRVRNRIASDLHDEVSATLSSISFFAQAIRQSPDNNKGKRYINLISESAGEAKEKITDIIWSIDPQNDDSEILLTKCRRFASDLLESKNIAYDIQINAPQNRPLKLELRQHLWLIFKEMVTNAARHSNADKVDILLALSSGLVTMNVQDNGTGFKPEEQNEGNGVANIRKRAEQIDAELTLESKAGMGTRYTLKAEL